MSDAFYLDTSVVLKACAYGAGQDLLDVATIDGLAPAMLASAGSVLASRIERSRIVTDKPRAAAQLETVLAGVRFLEPSDLELQHAADLEQAATQANLSLEAGESQLVAMLMARDGRGLLTGENRTVGAFSSLGLGLEKRLVCLEQVLHSILLKAGFEPLRSEVAREAAVDPAITVIFQCVLQQVALYSVLNGLGKASKALRAQSGTLLADGFGIADPVQ